MVWYKELGFFSNPLSIKPALFDTTVVGYDLGEIFEKIDQNQIVFIEGKYGYGKTTILKHIIQRYGGKGQIAYYNCNRVEGEVNVEAILRDKYGFFGQLFSRMPTDMILLLDEVETLDKKSQEELYKFYTQGNIKAIVMLGPDFESIDFISKIQKLLVNNVVELVPLNEEEAVELVKERVGDLKLLSDEIIQYVFEHSEKNPRFLLENLEDVCRYAYNRNEEEVKKEHVRKVLGISEDEPEKPSPRAKPQEQEGKKEKRESKKSEETEQKERETETSQEDDSEFFYY